MAQLPTVLVLQMFDCLSKPDLRACALTCSAWTAPAQSFLLQAIGFRFYDAELVLDAFGQSPHIWEIIRHVTLHCSDQHSLEDDGDILKAGAGEQTAENLGAMLKFCTRLETLDLRIEILGSRDYDLEKKLAFVPLATAICLRAVASHATTLHISISGRSSWSAEQVIQVQRLFSPALKLPRLRALHLGMQWTDDIPSITSSAGAQLRVLSFGTNPSYDYLRIERIAAGCPLVHTILLGDSELVYGDISWLASFLNLRTVELPRTHLVPENLDTLPERVNHVVLKDFLFSNDFNRTLDTISCPHHVQRLELTPELANMHMINAEHCTVVTRERR